MRSKALFYNSSISPGGPVGNPALSRGASSSGRRRAALRGRRRRAQGQPRESAELVARQLLAKLQAEPCGAVGEPLLSPGPWLLHRHQVHPLEPWTAESEQALRQHAARLKSDSAAIRATAPAPAMFTLHEDDEEVPASAPPVSMVDMEHAVMMQEVLVAREERAAALEALSLERARVNTLVRQATPVHRRREPRDREEKHWLDASETDL
ncbi:hypothetical protein JYU34_008321 [Plutella xylostella]|uniref:Uncharacterized protein n=1 Tax=Plutella xylostella TaxID=51655 RepID=A0ABQ7QP76_PLUXY|nr:hypothetical protein JYU34_008321 [Plutella xylostella]